MKKALKKSELFTDKISGKTQTKNQLSLNNVEIPAFPAVNTLFRFMNVQSGGVTPRLRVQPVHHAKLKFRAFLDDGQSIKLDFSGNLARRYPGRSTDGGITGTDSLGRFNRNDPAALRYFLRAQVRFTSAPRAGGEPVAKLLGHCLAPEGQREKWHKTWGD